MNKLSTRYLNKKRRKIIDRWQHLTRYMRIICRRQLSLTRKKHGLGKPLVVSLTSYPPRFPYLHLTLKCLLSQTVKPDRIVLWIAHEDKDLLPEKVLQLSTEGLEIRYCKNIFSFKKIIPALETFPDAYIATADDDVYYRSDWLGTLISASKSSPDNIIAHRIHSITSRHGKIFPYEDWEQDALSILPDSRNFPTGCMGVLYPPGSFHEDVTNAEKFLRLCPHADDIWLYWMANLAGTESRHSGSRHEIFNWKGTQRVGLWMQNTVDDGNNAQVEAMIEAYGLPWHHDHCKNTLPDSKSG